MSVKDLKHKAILTLASQVDSVASEHGFKRSPKSLAYRRKIESLVQKITVHVQRPSSYPNHKAAITAHVSCESKLVGERTLKLVRGRRDNVGNHPNLLFNFNAGLWRRQRNGIIWEPYDSKSWERFGHELAELLTQVAFSVFDTFSTLQALAQGFRDDNPHIAPSNTWWPIQAAAVFLVLGAPEEARTFLANRLALPQLRKRERALIERVLQRIDHNDG